MSLFEVLSALKEVELKPKFKVIEKLLGDPPCLVADSGNAQKLLHWILIKSEISEIVRSVVLATSKESKILNELDR